MKLFKQISSFLILTMFLTLANNVSAQSQDPCAGPRADLKRLLNLQVDMNQHPDKYSLADANHLIGEIQAARDTLNKCEQSHGNPGNPKTPAQNQPATPPQTGSAQPADPSNGSDKVHQAMLDALKAKQDAGQAAWNQLVGNNTVSYSLKDPNYSWSDDYKMTFNVAGTPSSPHVTASGELFLNGDHYPQKTITFNNPVYSPENRILAFSASVPQDGEVKIALAVQNDGSITFEINSSAHSWYHAVATCEPKLSEPRQKIRDGIANNPLLQDPPKDAPAGDGSGKPSGFTDGVDFSNDKSQTPPATPPPNQNP